MLPTTKHDHHHHHHSHKTHDEVNTYSHLIRHLTTDKDARKLTILLIINLICALLEVIYGFLSNSIGLLSDSAHMLFDSTALAVGIYASYKATLPANSKFSYGFDRFQTLSGLINGIFLIFIGFYIFIESLERMYNPPVIHSHKMIVVAVIGLIVNVVGVTFFHEHAHFSDDHSSCSHSHGKKEHKHEKHQHSHKHHNHSHSHHDHHHDHSDHEHSEHSSLTSTSNSIKDVEHSHKHSHSHEHGHNCNHDHSHEHSHSHSHSHSHNHDHHHAHTHVHTGACNHGHNEQQPDHHHQDCTHDHKLHSTAQAHTCEEHEEHEEHEHHHHNENLYGVFLHILADLLGSVGVITSSILIMLFDWYVADAICSAITSLLILASVVPLIKSSIMVFLQTYPARYKQPFHQALSEISQHPAIIECREPHLWAYTQSKLVCSLILVVKQNTDTNSVVEFARKKLNVIKRIEYMTIDCRLEGF